MLSFDCNWRLYNLIVECVTSRRRRQIRVLHTDSTTISPPHTYMHTDSHRLAKRFPERGGSQKLFVNILKAFGFLSLPVPLSFSDTCSHACRHELMHTISHSRFSPGFRSSPLAHFFSLVPFSISWLQLCLMDTAQNI